MKIACLDSRKKMVRKLYQENVDAYVKEYMGKPLDKIHVCCLLKSVVDKVLIKNENYDIFLV